jgi:outer membrane protein assembly factor BamB
MVSPLPPIIVNGVIFAASSGEYHPASGAPTAAERASRSVPAVVYALDADTDKEVWSSGRTVTSFVHSGGLWAGGGQVYLSTYDNTVYAFGYAMGRH